MIPASPAVVHSDSTLGWQEEIAQSLRSPQQLIELLQLPEKALQGMERGHRQFPIRATESFLRRIKPGNLHDPLLRQILPLPEEDEVSPGYLQDPVGDCAAACGNGILKKYHGRVLLITTPACGIHCRYCFRRHHPYREQSLPSEKMQAAIEWIQGHAEIHEVILSGGDPLMVGNRRLDQLLSALETIPHLKTLRIHTRMPIITPQRIDPTLLQRLQQSPLRIVMVIHCNHPNELDRGVVRSLESIAHSGITLLNQSVLLRGVNDSVSTLERLSHGLHQTGVLPYYLHLLDRVQGSHHFEVAEERAVVLMEKLGERVPGYLMPRLVREIKGESRKIPV